VFDEPGKDARHRRLSSRCATRRKGLRVARRETTMGLRGMPEGELAFEDLEVPAAWRCCRRRVPARLCRPDDAYNSQRVGAGTVAMGSRPARSISRSTG
jgi:alkylation response protein AidB-like acyl-CoA dehydrogenase